MSGFSCLACGDPTKPCCVPSSGDGTVKACSDGQTCGTDHMCPATVGPGWAGEPCGTGATQCNGTLACNATSNMCECNQASEWTTCSADGKSVCAPGSGPPPPSGGCANWPTGAGFKPTGKTDPLCLMFKGSCPGTDKTCAKGQFHTIMVNGKASQSCADSNAAGQAVLKSSFAGSTDPTQTNFCYVAA